MYIYICIHMYTPKIHTNQLDICCFQGIASSRSDFFQALHPHGRRPCIPVTWSRTDVGVENPAEIASGND